MALAAGQRTHRLLYRVMCGSGRLQSSHLNTHAHPTHGPPPLRRRSALHCGHGSGSGELSRGAAYPVVNPLLKLASRQRAASGAAAQQAQQAPHITPPVWQEQPGAGSSGGGGVGGGGARSPGAHHPPAH